METVVQEPYCEEPMHHTYSEKSAQRIKCYEETVPQLPTGNALTIISVGFYWNKLIHIFQKEQKVNFLKYV